MSARRGQALVLVCGIMLVAVLAVLVTFAIGHRTREKIKLQAVADSAAYSMAVAEARALNFYAFSNRAIVSHMVSVLSVHAHTSYLSWYEDMLQGTVRSYELLSRILDGSQPMPAGSSCPASGRRLAAAVKAQKIADEIRTSGRTVFGDFKDPCAGKADCEGKLEKLDFVRGAEWFHDYWQEKDRNDPATGKPMENTNFCYRLVEATRDHFGRVQLLRAHQLNVHHQVQWMMTGDRREKPLWDTDRLLNVDDLRPKVRQPRPPKPGEYETRSERGDSLPQELARQVDPTLHSKSVAEEVTLDRYRAAVSDGTGSSASRDFLQVVQATRFPEWLINRDAKGEDIDDLNWKRLNERIVSTIARHGAFNDTAISRAFHQGCAQLARAPDENAQSDPGLWNGTHKPYRPGQDESPNLVPDEYALPQPGAPPPNEYDGSWFGYRGPHGNKLMEKAHGPLGTDAIVAEDHGYVTSRWSYPGCDVKVRVYQREGRSGLWSDSHDEQRTDPTDPTVHSTHYFHGYGARVLAHELGDTSPLGQGVYRGHMRFKTGPRQNLWDMPRTYALITRDRAELTRMPDGTPLPWTLDKQLSTGSRSLRFTTSGVGAEPEADAMAALSGGLTYFHRPPPGDEREPPNLWNPYWRAKLHPLVPADARRALSDHAASKATLDDPRLGGRALNF